MKRGAIWTAAASGPYTGKPRPVLIVQSDRFDAMTSVTVVPLTADPVEAPLIRIPVAPDETNGLRAPSRLMIDKVTTMPRANLRDRVGEVDRATLRRVDMALLVFLGLAG